MTSYGAVRRGLGMDNPNGPTPPSAQEVALRKANEAVLKGEQKAADQAAIDALKAKNQAARATAASSAASLPGQSRIGEPVTTAERAGSDAYRAYVDKETGTGPGSGPQGMRKRLAAYANNEDIRQARNMEEQMQGSGIRFDKGADGGIVITNRGDFDGSTKAPYVDANGDPTSDWSKTSQYAQGMKQAETDRRTLRNMQTARAERSLESANPAYQEQGRRMLEALHQRDVLDQGQQKLGIEGKLADAQLQHYKALEAQYGRQAAAQMWTIQKGLWDDAAKQHDSFLDSQFGKAGADKDGNINQNRADFDAALQSALAKAGMSHRGQLSNQHLYNLVGAYKAGKAADKANGGVGALIEYLRGNNIEIGGDPTQTTYGPVQPGIFGEWVQTSNKGRQHVRTLRNSGWIGPADAVASDYVRNNIPQK